MLQTIRDHTQGWLAGTIVSVLILMFAMWGISAYFTGGNAGSVLAKVNGVAITKERFALSYEQARRQMQAQLGSSSTISNKQEAGLKDRVMQELISTEALKQASIKQNYYISSLQIDNYLESIPEFQDSGHFSLAKFQEVMATSLYTASDLLDLIRTNLLLAQPKLGIILTSVVFPNEANYVISLVNQERDFDYLNLTSAALADQAPVQISDQEIEQYYKAHEADYKTPEQVSIDYLELSLKDLIASSHPSQEMLKNYYNENINTFTQPGQWKINFILIPVTDKANQQQVADAQAKANSVLQQVRQGADFDKLAQQYTDTNLSNDLYGWLSLSQLPVALQKPVNALTKANPISDPVQIEQGFIILKLKDIQEAQVQSFDQVKAKVGETLARQQAEEKMSGMRDQLADLTYEHPDTLMAAAKTLNLAVKSSSMFTLDKGAQDISANKKVREAAFSSDVLTSQNNSDVIQVNPDSVIVLRVKSHVPPALIALKTVTQQIQERLRTEHTKVALSQLANDIYDKLQKGGQPNDVANTYKQSWNKVGFIGRYSTKVASAVVEKAFQLPRVQDAQGKASASYGVVQVPTGYAVIALRAVRDGVVKDQKQAALFAEQIENSQGLLEYEMYKQGILHRAKVKVENKA